MKLKAVLNILQTNKTKTQQTKSKANKKLKKPTPNQNKNSQKHKNIKHKPDNLNPQHYFEIFVSLSTSHIRNVKANSDLLLFRPDSAIILWNCFKDDMWALVTFHGLQ